MTKPDRTFETEIEIAAPKDAVWRAVTEAREIARWFAPSVEVDLRVGGAVVWQWGPHHTWRQTIEVIEPGQHLRTRYDSVVGDGRGGMRPLFIDFLLRGDGGTTTLRLVQSGFGPEAEFDQEYDGISSGWPVELRSLRLYLEQHRGQDRRLAWHALSTSLPPQEAWARLDRVLGVRALSGLREGAPFALAVEGAARLEGRTLFAPSPLEFSGVVDSHDGGWFRMHCGTWGGATQVWLWLALYGSAAAAVPRFQRAFEAALGTIVGAGEAGAAG